MLVDQFFSHIESHYKLKRPFVAYSKPNSLLVKSILQKDNAIHSVKDFTESGFVFSPFNSDEDTLIFPLDLCQIITSEFSLSSENESYVNSFATTEIDEKAHVELVQNGIDCIKDNQLQKVVLSRVDRVPISNNNPIQIFESLLKKYKSAFVYIWYHPNVGLWLGATPETLLELEGQRFKTMALAGTQPNTNSSQVDWDIKNLEEQQMVTDYIANILASHVNHINISEAKAVKAGKLLHLQSQISGLLKSKNLQDVIANLHPTPAVCGLPKSKAKRFIETHETYNREFYTGYLGELNFKTEIHRNTNRRNVENNAYKSFKTTSNLYVNLRCMQLKDSNALIYVGGGITKDSDAQEEWQETVSKSVTMKSILH